jgi:MYXO-CTERM domain-containing protein
VPTVDFYRDYRADGGTADGGFCSVGSGRSGGGWLLVGLVAAAMALGRRRRS